MVTFKAFFLELLILANYYWYRTQSAETVVFRIGALLSSPAVMKHFNDAANETIGLNGVNIKFEAFSDVMSPNAIRATDQVCDLIRQSRRRLSALVVSHPPNHPEQPPLSVSYTAAFFNLPTLGITARQSDFSDKTAHNMFFRTVPPYSQEILVFRSIMKKLEWDHANIIHTTNNEGRNLLALLQKDEAFKISSHVGIEEDANVTQKLLEMSFEQTRLVILYVNADIAEKVFDAAVKLKMLEKNWAWLVTEQVFKAKNVPPGILGVQLYKSLEGEHVKDAVRVLKKGIMDAYKEKASDLKSDLVVDSCKTLPSMSLSTSTGGAGTLYQYLKAVELKDGVTGGLSFDDRGDRKQARFHIVNKHVNDTLVTVGSYESTSSTYEADDRRSGSKKKGSLNISLNRIYWPGNYRNPVKKEICTSAACFWTTVNQPPKSFKKKTHLKVVTQESIPFMYKRDRTDDKPCKKESDPKTLRGELDCFHIDPLTGIEKKYCCFGYCVDILRRLANRSKLDGPERPATDFSFDLHLVGDGEIGREISEGPDKKKKWTGIIEELASEKADLAVAPMTITPERAAKIEFTKPFKYLGITIIVKRESNPKSNLGSFLQPFDNTLWVLVFLSVHVVALVLYLLDRFSPFGRYKFARGNDADEDTLNLSSAMWFAWGVLLNSGIGEGTPRSFSARVLGMVWAGFAMIIVASYTANLAAFLVLDRPKAIISGIDDPRLRNPGDFKFATVKDSPVEAYFKTQLEYDTMLRTMQKYVYTTAEEALQDVKSGDLKAFIWDSPRLEYEASAECDLKTAGEIFGRTGYGLGLRKDSPWFYEMSQAVLNFHESGVMEELDSEWILVKAANCPNLESTPATLGLTNMAGVFIMVAAGIVAGVFLIFIEMAYKKRTGLKEKELELAKNAADRWRGNIEKRKILRKTRAAELLEKEMPLLGMGGVGYSMPSSRYLPNQAMHQDYKRTIQLRNQNGIFAEQPIGRV